MNGYSRGVSADARLPGQTKLKMHQAKVKSMLRRTSYAVSTDENRYVLNVYLSFKENKLTIVATDGSDWPWRRRIWSYRKGHKPMPSCQPRRFRNWKTLRTKVRWNFN